MSYYSEFLRSRNAISKDHAMTLRAVLRALGKPCSDKEQRRLRSAINYTRKTWTPDDGWETFILSSTDKGYYLPATVEECREFVQRHQSQAKHLFSTVTKLNRHLKQLEIKL